MSWPLLFFVLKGMLKMKEFNFWCKENTDFGKCDNKKCGFFECGCYGYCDECVYHFMDSTVCENCSAPQFMRDYAKQQEND